MQAQPLPVSFVNIAREAGLREKNTFGDERKNRYLVETTGCGVAFYDYDHDGWLDLFFVNGSRFQANFAGAPPLPSSIISGPVEISTARWRGGISMASS